MYFTSIPLFGPLVPMSLKTFYSMLFSLVDIRFVNQKGWIIMRGAQSAIEEISHMYIAKWTNLRAWFSLYGGGVQSYFDHFLVFCGRTPHPCHVLFFFTINISFVFDKKKVAHFLTPKTK